MSSKALYWNQCFLCSSPLEGKYRENCFDRKKFLERDITLIKYILKDPSLESSLSKDVIGLIEDESLAGCEDCDKVGNLIADLHFQLKDIQRKIKDQLDVVNKVVITNSRVYGGNSEVKEAYSSFEKSIQEKEIEGEDCTSGRKLLDVLHHFQTFVFENDDTESLLLQPVVPVDVQCLVSDDVKEEPLDSPLPEGEEFLDNGHFENEDREDSLIPQAKVEFVEQPQRKQRKAAQLAASRLHNVRPPKVQAPPRPDNSQHIRAIKLRRAMQKEAFQKKCVGDVKKRTRKVKKGGRKKWLCDQCSFVTWATYQVEHHLRQHETLEKNYECPDCVIGFTTKQALMTHLNHHFNRSKCDICEESVVLVDMESHLKDHGVQVYSCPQCICCFGVFKNLAFHAIHHPGLEVKCGLCPVTDTRKYSVRSQLNRHLSQCHGCNETQYKCEHSDCSQVFFDLQILKAHQFTHLRIHSCSTCDKSFSDDKALDLHIRAKHPEKVTLHFWCEGSCLKKFPTEAALLRHKFEEHGHSIFKCEQCSPIKNFISKDSLRTHLRKEHEVGRKLPTYKCGQCSKIYTKPQRLKDHLALVHLRQKDFTCEVCGFATHSESNLRNHSKTHAGDEVKVFACDHCSKKFSRKDYLIMHSRVHTLEKPFQCETCGSAFSQKGSLIIHMKKHEEGKEFTPRPKKSRSKNGGSSAVSLMIPDNLQGNDGDIILPSNEPVEASCSRNSAVLPNNLLETASTNENMTDNVAPVSVQTIGFESLL